MLAADEDDELPEEYLVAADEIEHMRPKWITADAERYVDSPFPAFRAAAALSRTLPDDAVRRLLDDEDGHVRITMARTAPHLVDPVRAEHIERAYRSTKFTWWWERDPVLTHSTEVMRRFAVDPARRLRALAATDPELPPELVAELAADPEAAVREAVAAHPLLPARLLSALLDDESDRVVRAAGASAYLPASEMERLLRLAGL